MQPINEFIASSHYDLVPSAPVRSESSVYEPFLSDFPSFFKKPSKLELQTIIHKCSLTVLKGWCFECSIVPTGPQNTKLSFAQPIFDAFWSLFLELCSLNLDQLKARCLTLSSFVASTQDAVIFTILGASFPPSFLLKLIYVTRFNKNANFRAARAKGKASEASSALAADQSIIDRWPEPIDPEFALTKCREYVTATTLSVQNACVSCGRSFFARELTPAFSFSFDDTELPDNHPLLLFFQPNLILEPISPPGLPAFLSDLCLHHPHLVRDDSSRQTTLNFCTDCLSSVNASKVPKFSLSNDLYRGQLPDDLRDISWIEEKVCALHRVTADVARLQNAEADEKLPYRLVGNTCAHPVNVPSTAAVLPRTPADINDCLTIVFVGPTFDKTKLPPMFRVRKRVISRFLSFLADNNPLYASVPISQSNLDLYPDDDVLPLLDQGVILNNIARPLNVLKQETAAFEQHPILSSDNQSELGTTTHDDRTANSDAAIESTGVIDLGGMTINGHSATAAALFNLLRPRKPNDEPDLLIPRGAAFVNDYDNPALFPGMFPTLFPRGTGGIEYKRMIPISFHEHVNYLLSLHDPIFKHHRLFLFVAVSIIKKRLGHLQTAFTVRKRDFISTAAVLSSVSADTLAATARHLQANRPYSELSADQKLALTCLKQLNIVSTRIPGSPASKIYDRSCIRGYFGLFGLPHIYLTMNPATAHSPVLQVFFGDTLVDLTQRFPSMPLPGVRAKRIAKDPVAAADFFVFSIKMFLKHLLGYDYDTHTSVGGILGHIKCFYGKSECTMRGCLHGHFVIWLLGGLNPRDLHNKLNTNADFKRRFFEFWEQIIKHDAPGDEIDLKAAPEPRVQRPPSIDDPHWESTFTYDIKLCAESLQRHSCQEVCWKYANVKHIPREKRMCRFQFPHELVPESFYDPASKSVVMACNDATMNYYNPHVLAFCRHNHDIKCILSGKAAKAAMFYITNYITKDDLHTHQILSMMSAAITSLNEDANASPVDRAKARLHRWVSHLARLQEIHAQMAVMYIRGIGDTFASHETIPMLSLALLAFLRSAYPDNHADIVHEPVAPKPVTVDQYDSDEDENEEQLTVPLRRAANGQIFTEANQVDDYIYRDVALASFSFYQFVCCVRKEKGERTTPVRLGAFSRHSLEPQHPQSATHYLVLHQDPDLPLHKWRAAPRILGMQVPRSGSKEYALFMLGHFKAFSSIVPLFDCNDTPAAALQTFEMPSFAQTIMRNWEDVHECEDERDAERMRRNQRVPPESVEINSKIAALARGEGDDDDGPLLVIDPASGSLPSANVDLLLTLKTAGWFKKDEQAMETLPVDGVGDLPRPSAAQLKMWSESLKRQEEDLRRARFNSANLAEQQEYSIPLPSTQMAASLPNNMDVEPPCTQPRAANPRLPRTVTSKRMPSETAEQMIQRVGDEMTLNPQQWIAYLIVARKFVADLALPAEEKSAVPPLRLLLTGPGGTGKSHVVKTLKKLMGEYGMEHQLRLVAPTGSAAALIDATTVHRSLGIQVKKKKSENKDGNNGTFVASVSAKKKLELEMEWRGTEWLFCDECSLLGANLNAEIDQMLRMVKSRDTWYGGVNMLFAGDFSQYPPVQQSPLYEPITPNTGSKTNGDFMRRLGRLAWLSVNVVVELTEQKRMALDQEYGAAVARLRMRECSPVDLDLFNSRVVSSRWNPIGVELTARESEMATTIVRDNRTRLFLNIRKATALVPPSALVMVAARDSRKGGTGLIGDEQKAHLEHDFSSTISSGGLPSFIPLAIGMNVVLRNRNISPELKIANGSMGVLVALFMSPNGPYQSADSAIVYFPASNVQIGQYPVGCVHIVPESTSYCVMAGRTKVSYRRKQLLIEPAYAVTGHFAQGKTLPVVVANLAKGGPAAYVAASRPTSRQGLFLLQKLTLKDLNSPPLPPHLLKELDRFEAIKHNTLVEYGFSKETKVPVPGDAEMELAEAGAVRLEWDVVASRGTKRKAIEQDRPSDNAPSKAPRFSILDKGKQRLRRVSLGKEAVAGQLPTQESAYPYPFLKWDGPNYSCAYDSILTPLYATWIALSPHQQTNLLGSNVYLDGVLNDFRQCADSPSVEASANFHATRTNVRRQLAELNPRMFPLTGHNFIPLEEVFCALGLDRQLSLWAGYHCDVCDTVSAEDGQFDLYYVFSTGTIRCFPEPVPNVITVQAWIAAQLSHHTQPDHRCAQCQQPTTAMARPMDAFWPALLVFQPNPSTFTCLVPSLELTLPAGELQQPRYRLTGITFAGNSHFTARIRVADDWWEYDGMRSQPQKLPIPAHLPAQQRLKFLVQKPSSSPMHYLYARRTDVTSDALQPGETT